MSAVEIFGSAVLYLEESLFTFLGCFFRLAWLAAVKLMMPGQFLLFCLVWFGSVLATACRLPLPINMQYFWMAEFGKKSIATVF